MARHGLTVAVAIGKPKGGALDAPPEVGGPKAAPPAPGDAEPDADDQNKQYPDPAAAGFRNEGETCEACTFNDSGNCTVLGVPVGLTCSLYQAHEGESADLEAAGAPAPAGASAPAGMAS